MVCCNCNGDGQHYCRTCGGSGKIGTNPCYGCYGSIKIKCRDCDGSGNGPCSPRRRLPLDRKRKVFVGILLYVLAYLFVSLVAIGGNKTIVMIKDYMHIPFTILGDVLLVFLEFITQVTG